MAGWGLVCIAATFLAWRLGYTVGATHAPWAAILAAQLAHTTLAAAGLSAAGQAPARALRLALPLGVVPLLFHLALRGGP